MALFKVDEAIRFAAGAHAGEFRDGEEALPYITHPIEVLLNLRFVGGVTDEDLLTAAVLHDVVEDAGRSYAPIIEAEFGPVVLAHVLSVTRQEPTSAEIAGLSSEQAWQVRSEKLLEEIRRMGPDAHLIKLADRLANVRDAKRSKSARKLVRYLWQTQRILEIIPRESGPDLWDTLRIEVPEDPTGYEPPVR